MAPQTRKSQASSSQDHPPASTSTSTASQHIQIPADVSTDQLAALVGPADWSNPAPENVITLYRLVIQQKHDFDAAFRDWEERLAQKDAEVEQALHDQETFRTEYTEQMEVLRTEIEGLKHGNEALEKDRAPLQAQLAALSSSTSVSGAEVQQLKVIVEEREKEKKNLTDALDGALSRETRLHSENTELRTEIQNARKTASELQAKLAVTASAESTLQFKVSTLEQQISLLQEGNDKLNNEYSEQLTRYAELRRARAEEISTLQIKLDQKTADHDREAERARSLQAAHGDLERKLQETLEKNRDLQSNETANARAFQEEMQICKDLLKQYEKIADEAKARVADIENEEEAIRTELAKREESLLAQTERERERAENAERKVEELEEVLQRMQVGEFSMADTSFGRARTPMSPGPGAGMTSLMLSPTASIVSKFQRGGRSVTEVYADYVRLQKELQTEKQEKARLETTLNDIFNEIQDRAPILTQQRLEYDRVSAEARQLAEQLSEAMEERDQQSRAAREAKHTLAIKQKEIDILNKTSIDNARQIRGLMHQIARANDPTLPQDFDEDMQPANGVSDVEAYVSSNLVLFRSLPQLQQRNQELLKLTHTLAAQLEERERQAAAEEESEVMAEARMVIESQQAQLKTNQAKLEAYIKERDALKKRVLQLQAGGATAESGNVSFMDGMEDYHQKYDEEHAAHEAFKRESAKGFEALQNELKEARSELTKLHIDLGKARATVEYHMERYKLVQANITSQAEELKALRERNSGLEVYVRQSEAKNGELSATLAAYSGNVAKMESEAQLLRSEKALQKSREDRLEQENRQLHAERARNNQTLEDYRRMKDELSFLWEENKQTLEKEKARLESEVTNLRDEIMNDRASARTRMTERDSEVRDLNHRLTQLRDESIKSREAVAVAQATQSHLQARADDLNKQLQRALEKLAVFERRPGTVGLFSADAGGSEEENLRAQVAELSAELKSAQVELTRERANVTMYQELAQTAEMALEEERKTKDETISRSQQELAHKETQLVSLQERVTVLQIELQRLSEQKAALEAEMESKEAQFQQEKNILEGIVADVNGADERAIRAQQVTQQELLAEAQKTREAQQKYQAMLVDHAAVLKERDTLHQQLQEAQISATQHLEDAKAAKSILTNSQKSWELQAESLKQEVTDLQSRYDSQSRQNDILHKQLASITAQAAKMGELPESTLAAIEAPSSDVQVQELQQVIQHLKRDGDLLRGQQELLKRENARLNGDIRRLTSELEFTRQRLAEEREMASKSSLAPNDQQALLAKVSENAALIENNRNLRSEKAQLEERLAKKSDELITSQSEISPLRQEVITLRSERDYIKIENEALQTSIDQWRKRATSIMTKFERIDPEAHEQLKAEKEALETEIGTLKANLTRANEQTAKWKDAQQQWKNAVQTVTEQSKERQSQLAAERDAATAQNEAITRELETVRTELQKSRETAGKAAPAADSSVLSAELAQLNEQKAALQAENNSLREQLTTLQANPAAAAAPSADVEKYQQQIAEGQKRFQDLQARARAMALELKTRGEKIANLEREAAAKSAESPADTEAVVAQRVGAAVAQARAEQEAALAAAVAPLQAQIATLSQGQPDVAQLQQQHAAEIKALQDQLAAATAGGVSDAAVEAKINERLAAINAEHAAALARATESGRMEAETKLKMVQMQFTRARQELAQLKAAAQAGTGATQPLGAAGPSAGGPATPVAAPGNAVAPGVPASPTVARGRGRGAAPGRGAPPTRGIARGAAPPAGIGRGSVLDAVNQAIAGGTASPGSPGGQLSILGASGQKRGRDEEMVDVGSLAKRMKPGEATLPAKPAGRGTAAPINRGRIPGAPEGST